MNRPDLDPQEYGWSEADMDACEADKEAHYDFIDKDEDNPF